MISFARRWLLSLAVASGLMLSLSLGACVETDSEDGERSRVDTRLDTHQVLDGEPSEAGLAYVQAIADAHRQADRLSDHRAQISTLLAAIEQPWPAGDGVAELLHYETLARAAELLLAEHDDDQVLELLGPRLAPEQSLPLDRASARCLVALGDAAARTGDHALAMGSYTRAMEMLMLLIEEAKS